MKPPLRAEKQPLALIVSGAFETPGIAATRSRYHALGDIVLGGRDLDDGLIMLAMGTPVHGFGPLFGCSSFEKIYDKTAPILDRKIRDRESDVKVNLFGYSMGGAVVAIYGHRNPQTVGKVTGIAPASKGIYDHLDYWSNFNPALRSTAQEIDELRTSNPLNVPEYNIVASEEDEIVPSALALSAVATRTLLITGNASPAHLHVPTHSVVLDFSRSITMGMEDEYMNSLATGRLTSAA